jgi:hypothetical protein
MTGKSMANESPIFMGTDELVIRIDELESLLKYIKDGNFEVIIQERIRTLKQAIREQMHEQRVLPPHG